MDLFEIAVRKRIRIDLGEIEGLTRGGRVGAEDLYRMHRPSLNTIYKHLAAQMRIEGEDSLDPNDKSSKSEDLEIKVELVKHIYNVKLKEEEDRRNKEEAREKVRRLENLATIAEDRELSQKSPEELRKMAEEAKKKLNS